MIEKLKSACGNDYTNKLIRMYSDFENSKQLSEEFHKVCSLKINCDGKVRQFDFEHFSSLDYSRETILNASSYKIPPRLIFFLTFMQILKTQYNNENV